MSDLSSMVRESIHPLRPRLGLFHSHALSRGILACILISFAKTPAPAQTQPSFEVSAIKPHVQGSGYTYSSCSGERYVSVGDSLASIIEWAYRLKPYQYEAVSKKLPTWASQPGGIYDIEAAAQMAITEDQCKLMVQKLLVERFNIVIHWDSKDGQVYDLVVARDGPKIQKVVEGDRETGVNVTINGAPLKSSPGAPIRLGLTMPDLADFLSASTNPTPVVDKTGLEGTYKIKLAFSGPRRATDGTDPDIYSAVEQQLGLKLEQHRGALQFLIVDSIDRPNAN